MKKIIITTCAILMMSVTANACGGITVKGNSGATYCLSKHTMNWYSAYARCHDQGMRLIDIETVCKNYNSCPELTLSADEKKHITDNGGTVDWVCTNTSRDSRHTFNVSLSSGAIGYVYRYGDSRYYSYALCF